MNPPYPLLGGTGELGPGAGDGSIPTPDLAAPPRDRDLKLVPRHVLLVEDDPDQALLVTAMLSELALDGIDVVHAGSLTEAIAAIRTTAMTCALLDLGLPDAVGLDVLHQLQAMAPDVPVVILTGDDDHDVALEALQNGAQDYLVKGTVNAELLTRAIRYAIERKRLDQQLTHLALHDPLTGLPNRTLFMDRLRHALSSVGTRTGDIATLLLDIDNFKVINDGLGHEAGDALLQQVSQRLSTLMRSIDTVGRFGGDEFAILCNDLSGPEQAAEIGVRIMRAMSRSFNIGGREAVVRASVGIAMASAAGERAEDLVRDADAAMYQAKSRGRGRVEFFDPSMRSIAFDRLDMETALFRALEFGEFRLMYQPIISLSERRVVGFEALIRWDHPTRGSLAPSAFISLAEESGLISEIGRWVLKEACDRAVEWAANREAEKLQMSVNLSPKQLECSDVVRDVVEALESSGLDARDLTLELTESTLMQLDEQAEGKLTSLRDLGVHLALDDFGTGYSSLSYLQRFPMETVKVDRSFIRNVGHSEDQSSFARAIVALCRSLGLQTVAEGIENPEQVEALQDMDCLLGQGFFLAEPLGAADVPIYLETSAPTPTA